MLSPSRCTMHGEVTPAYTLNAAIPIGPIGSNRVLVQLNHLQMGLKRKWRRKRRHAEEQTAFRRRKRTQDQISILKTIMNKSKESDQPLSIS